MAADFNAPERAAEPRGWLGWSLIAGVLFGIPAGWLLAILIALPAFLGLFFYLLIGLLIGAIMFRLGKPAAPMPRSRLRGVGTFVAFVIWLSGLATEYKLLPGHIAETVIHSSVIQSIPEQELRDFDSHTRQNVLAYLRTEYPPGGFAGYLRWMATTATLKVARPGNQEPYIYRPLAMVIHDREVVTVESIRRRILWLVRLALSLLLVSYSIVSQLAGLAPERPVAENAVGDGRT